MRMFYLHINMLNTVKKYHCKCVVNHLKNEINVNGRNQLAGVLRVAAREGVKTMRKLNFAQKEAFYK